MNTPELLSLQTAPTSTDHSLRILLVASEIDPLVKVGGLGDVTGSLPPALRALPVEQTGGWPLDIRIAIPFHSVIATRIKNIQPLVSFTVPHPHGDIAAQAFQTFLANPSKALIALVGLICLTVLIAVDAIAADSGLPVITAIVGYAIGNGIAAKQGQPVDPIIGRKPKP